LNEARLKVIAALPVNEYDQSVEDEVRAMKPKVRSRIIHPGAMVLATNEGRILNYEAWPPEKRSVGWTYAAKVSKELGGDSAVYAFGKGADFEVVRRSETFHSLLRSSYRS
jgi:RecJ-like exonuclease